MTSLYLHHAPILDSLHVYLNGTKGRLGVDYDYVTGPPRITPKSSWDVRRADKLEARYAWSASDTSGGSGATPDPAPGPGSKGGNTYPGVQPLPVNTPVPPDTCPALVGQWLYPESSDAGNGDVGVTFSVTASSVHDAQGGCPFTLTSTYAYDGFHGGGGVVIFAFFRDHRGCIYQSYGISLYAGGNSAAQTNTFSSRFAPGDTFQNGYAPGPNDPIVRLAVYPYDSQGQFVGTIITQVIFD